MRLAEILAQIDDLDAGHRRDFRRARPGAASVYFPCARVMETFERGRGGAEQRHRAFELRAHDGDIAPVVARRFFLLVAGLLLLVHDDQADIFERRKNGRARAHHDARFAAAHAPPFAGALRDRQPAVQHGDAFAKPRAAQAAHPERERDLRHQHERRAAARSAASTARR